MEKEQLPLIPGREVRTYCWLLKFRFDRRTNLMLPLNLSFCFAVFKPKLLFLLRQISLIDNSWHLISVVSQSFVFINFKSENTTRITSEWVCQSAIVIFYIEPRHYKANTKWWYGQDTEQGYTEVAAILAQPWEYSNPHILWITIRPAIFFASRSDELERNIEDSKEYYKRVMY